MKKITAIICTLALLTAFTGCNNGETSGGAPESTAENSAPENTEKSESGGNSESAPESTDNSESAPESSASEESKGEPTFLTCVDGTVIYTSDITSLNSDDAKEEAAEIPIEELDEERFINDAYSVICDGFAYAFTSKDAFNPVQNPELFKVMEGFEDVEMMEYVGEEIAPSSEYYRVEPGDKFGELTVKSATTNFYANYSSYEGKNINGAYTFAGALKFDGELELTGYVRVSEANEGYDEGGEIRFVPDNECSDKIPVLKYEVSEENGAVQHSPMGNFNGTAYNDINLFSLGNIHDYSDIDLDGLEVGERFTRVKITIGDIVSSGSNLSRIDAKLLSLEKIKTGE